MQTFQISCLRRAQSDNLRRPTPSELHFLTHHVISSDAESQRAIFTCEFNTPVARGQIVHIYIIHFCFYSLTVFLTSCCTSTNNPKLRNQSLNRSVQHLAILQRSYFPRTSQLKATASPSAISHGSPKPELK
jgi:hypothetical protein